MEMVLPKAGRYVHLADLYTHGRCLPPFLALPLTPNIPACSGTHQKTTIMYLHYAYKHRHEMNHLSQKLALDV